jgi:hypothetical protein
MATHKYNVAKSGTRDKDVTAAVGAAITSGVVEITVDLAVTATKREVLRSIDTVARYIRKNAWPPA